MIMIIIIIITLEENDYNNVNNNSHNDDNDYNDNNSDDDDDDEDEDEDDENNDNDNDDDKLPVDSPHKGPIMLSFDVTLVVSKNNSWFYGDLRRHVPQVTSLWCDVFTQHRHICIIISSNEQISSHISIFIQNCVRCNWLWWQQSNQRCIPLLKKQLILRLGVFFVVRLGNFWKEQSSC